MNIYESFFYLVGKTPIVRLSNYKLKKNINCDLLAKLESFNPAGSAKDRIAVQMIEAAEREGKLKKGSTIIESTSGNTGIGLAAAAAAKGYKIIITMPESMSVERRKLLQMYGAQLVLTDAKKGIAGALDEAQKLLKETPNSFMPAQFSNPENPQAHYDTTGPEIWEDTDGSLDIFVCSVGTGGTVSGAGKFLKEKNPKIKIVAVEPAESPLLSGGTAAPHKIQGIGANFIPETLDKNVYDEVVCVSADEAFSCARLLARTEGFLVGISSGAVLAAIEKIAQRYPDKRIVAFLTDGGEKYLSTELFE